MRSLKWQNLVPTKEYKFEISILIKASKEATFNAWTISEKMKNWWGPTGFDVAKCDIDLNYGGTNHYCLKTPEGMEMWGKSVYKEITPHDKLVFVNSFSDENAAIVRNPFNPNWPLETITKLEFEEKDGQTELRFTSNPIHATDSEWEMFQAAEQSMLMGWNGTLGRLKAYLENKK